MRLLIATGIYPPEIGGPAGYVRGLASELAKRGHQIAVVTYGDQKTSETHDVYINDCRSEGNRSDRKNLQIEKSSEAFELTVVPRAGGPLVRYFRYMLAVRRLAKHVDLVYLQGPVSEGLPGMLGAKLAGKSIVLKVVGDYAWEQYQQTMPISHAELILASHGANKLRGIPKRVRDDESIRSFVRDEGAELLDEFLAHRHSGKIRLFEAIERWAARKAKTIIVPSKYLKTVVERWGIGSEKIKVIYNSIAKLPGGTPSNSPLAGGGSENGGVRLLTAVRAVPWKGGDFLCDCLKELPNEFILAVAGEGPSLEAWKKHADEIGVSNRVIWLGRLSRAELADWYRKADLFVLATGYEGFPHVVVEACSVGLPCIVSDKGGNPETKDFFPSLVTIAPYLDKHAWVEAIKTDCRSEGSRTRPKNLPIDTSSETLGVLNFDRMVDETIEELKKNI